MNLAGKDATEDFEDTAHSQKARDWTDRYIIGVKEGASDETKESGKIPAETSGSQGGGGMGMSAVIG